MLRVRRSGRRVYRFQVRRNRWITIGAVDDFEPDEARDEADKLRGAVAHGQDPHAERRRAHAESLDLFLSSEYEPWATVNLKTGATPTTKRVRAAFPKFLPLPLNEIDDGRIERWRIARLAAGVEPATVNRDIAALRSVFKAARKLKILKTRPFEDIGSLKVDASSVTRFLSAAEERRLREALAARDQERRAARERANVWRRDRGYPEWPPFGTYTDHLTPIVLLALNTGLRRGELLNLAWRDVDLERGLLTVQGSGTKSGQSRVVPLNSEAISVLKAWQPADDDGRVVPFRRGRRGLCGLVFPGDDGERMSGLKTAFLAIMKAAKVTDFRLHDLRHTFASKLVQVGVDLNTVRELLGHADLKMALRYSHLAPEHRAAAVAKLVQA